MKILAERLRQLQDEYDEGKRISNEKLAQRLDVSVKSVKTWLRDEGDPSLPSLLAIADFFNVDPAWLLGRTDQRGSSQRDSHKV